MAVWLIANAKNDITSYEVARSLGVTQKTGWFMPHRIPLAMLTGTFQEFSGDVEVDETYTGGRARFMHPGKRAAKIMGRGGMNKTAVMGLLERHGKGRNRVIAKVIGSTRKKPLQAEVRQNVQAGGTRLYTDALASYDGLTDYDHHVIDHAEAYVVSLNSGHWLATVGDDHNAVSALPAVASVAFFT
jgi:hypothetical protein